MTATERFVEIEFKFSSEIINITLIEFDESSVRLILHLKNGTNLRIAEQWDGKLLKRYSYYWLAIKNELIIGWDNAPHHTSVDTYPHHKHVKIQKNIKSSEEVCLEDVMEYIIKSN